jgi:hypothetical protein
MGSDRSPFAAAATRPVTGEDRTRLAVYVADVQRQQSEWEKEFLTFEQNFEKFFVHFRISSSESPSYMTSRRRRFSKRTHG